MKSRLGLAVAIALAAVPVLVRAEDQPAPATAVPSKAAIDPARMAAAKHVADALMPPGTYAKVMNASFSAIISQVADGISAMPLADLSAMSGRTPAEINAMGKTTLPQVMTIVDPHYRERTQRTMQAMFASMSDFMAQMEPSLRDGMAEAYADRFTIDQLADINRFFTTPTGHAYAATVLTIGTDPAMMSRMRTIMPAMLKQLPTMMEKAKVATADLPPPRKVEDLSPAERAKLNALLGVPDKAAKAPSK